MRRAKDAGALLAPIGVASVAIVCCAGLPVLAGAFAGLSLVTILGVGGGLVGLIAVLAGVVLALHARRRRSYPPTTQKPTP
jgi:hypothetical protein